MKTSRTHRTARGVYAEWRRRDAEREPTRQKAAGDAEPVTALSDKSDAPATDDGAMGGGSGAKKTAARKTAAKRPGKGKG
jgi:hypothetical protein